MQWAVKKLNGKALVSLLQRIARNACIYETWRERNDRLFDGKEGTPMLVDHKIREAVRIQLQGMLLIAAYSINTELHDTWNLNTDMLVNLKLKLRL